MDKEIIATMTCPVCEIQRGTIFAVPTSSSGVKHNVTEPEGITHCPECNAVLQVVRVG